MWETHVDQRFPTGISPQETCAAKNTEIRDRVANLKLQLEVLSRSADETAELAMKVFELSQTLRRQWVTADYAAKRRLLDIVCLNCLLDDVTLCPTLRKPFDALEKGLISENTRGDWHSFEPSPVLVEGYMTAFVGPMPSYLLAAERLAARCA